MITLLNPLQDVALVSLSNVLYRSGFDMDALAVIHMSLEVGYSSPSLEVNVVCFPFLRGKSPLPLVISATVVHPSVWFLYTTIDPYAVVNQCFFPFWLSYIQICP